MQRYIHNKTKSIVSVIQDSNSVVFDNKGAVRTQMLKLLGEEDNVHYIAIEDFTKEYTLEETKQESPDMASANEASGDKTSVSEEAISG